MPLGISPSVRPKSDCVQLNCRLALTAVSFRLLYSYNPTAHRKLFLVPVLHCEQNAASDTYGELDRHLRVSIQPRPLTSTGILVLFGKQNKRGRVIRQLDRCTWEPQ